MEARRFAVHPNNVDMLDFSRTSLALGVQVKGRPWLQLDVEDLKILHALLTKELAPGIPSAAEGSEALGLLAQWAAGAHRWSLAHPTPVTPVTPPLAPAPTAERSSGDAALSLIVRMLIAFL